MLNDEIHDDSYLLRDLPEPLLSSFKNYLKNRDRDHREYFQWDLDYDELSAAINCSEVDQQITHEQADYLRKYLSGEK